MSITQSNTFDVDPGSSFFSISKSGANPVANAIYDDVNKAFNITTNSSTGLLFNIISYQISIGVSDFVLEVDMEIISVYSGFAVGIGLSRLSDLSPAYLGRYYAPSGWQIISASGWSSVSQLILNNSLPVMSAGKRNIWKFSRTGSVFTLHIDGVLYLTIPDSAYSDLTPCIYAYAANLRIHSVSWMYKTLDEFIPKHISLSRLNRGNSETVEQSWPGENNWKQTETQVAKKAYGVTTAAMLNSPPLRKDFGFIEGVITRKTAPAVGQHVICLDDRFNLVAETLSGAGGHYRFDSLPINGLYAIHAYDNNEYKYAPVGADRRTPEAYS